MKKKGVTSVFDSIAMYLERVEFWEFFGVRSNPQINKGVVFWRLFGPFSAFVLFFELLT